MPVTQEDVAIVAGVSRKTVSNVVNRYPHVSKDVIKRVEAAIAELGYTPNHAARSLRTGKTRTIQLVIPELDVSYFGELARWVVAFAEEANLAVLVRQTLGDIERERRAIEGELGEYADGTILSPVSSNLETIMSRRSKTPLVLVGELGGEGSLPHVGIDNEAAAYAATAHLTSLGKRRIAFIGAQASSGSRMAQMRRRGYEAALRDAGMEVDEQLIEYTVAYHRADGAAAFDDLLVRGVAPDALFCATDLLALGALRAAHDAGLRTPEDLAIIGFDDIEEGRYSIPSLTTISPDKRAIAERAVRTLADAFEAGGDVPPTAASEETVPFRVIARESTAR